MKNFLTIVGVVVVAVVISQFIGYVAGICLITGFMIGRK